jgi:hypothetical protein
MLFCSGWWRSRHDLCTVYRTVYRTVYAKRA